MDLTAVFIMDIILHRKYANFPFIMMKNKITVVIILSIYYAVQMLAGRYLLKCILNTAVERI